MSKHAKIVHHIKSGNLPLCIVGCNTAKHLGHPTCGARSLAEAEKTVFNCKANLRKAGLKIKDFDLTIVEGHCPESIKR